MVPVDEARVVEKGALGPGQMLAVDMEQGTLFHDTEIKNLLASSLPFGDWVGRINDLDAALRGVTERALHSGQELRKRQVAAGYSIEELEQILAPMAEDGKELVASMGDDTPSAVLSERYRPLSHFFRQNFSQVTNPPIDSLREHRVMSLKTRFGNLKNVLDEDSSQTEIFTLESPVVSNGQFGRMIDSLHGSEKMGELRQVIEQHLQETVSQLDEMRHQRPLGELLLPLLNVRFLFGRHRRRSHRHQPTRVSDARRFRGAVQCPRRMKARVASRGPARSLPSPLRSAPAGAAEKSCRRRSAVYRPGSSAGRPTTSGSRS